jgi:hypothetical protein
MSQKVELGEDVAISVERMMRFCHLAEMTFEYAPGDNRALPLHLTRFGVLVFETASFLYSLFEERRDSINLVNVWQGFEHPFYDELDAFVKRLNPFKKELKLVRHRVGFHGSLNRIRERAGLGIFDVDSSRARDFSRLILDMQQLSLRMIAWYMKRMDSSPKPEKMWKELLLK